VLNSTVSIDTGCRNLIDFACTHAGRSLVAAATASCSATLALFGFGASEANS